jgi:hypothetical protein
MPLIHFLNVKDGDCSIIQHYSGRATVIDVCNAVKPDVQFYETKILQEREYSQKMRGTGNFNQKRISR